jgi:hypothetical protein
MRCLENTAESLGGSPAFCKNRRRLFPADIRLEDLTEFRAEWMKAYPSSTTRAKVQERLRAVPLLL